MEKAEKIISRLSLVFAIILAAAIIIGLIIMALFSRPIADQYGFMSGVNKEGVLGYTVSQYTTWSGRLIQPFGIGVMYRIFGDDTAQMVVPFLFLILFSAVWSWLIYQIINFKKHKVIFSILIGSLIAGGILCTTVCLFDIFLWLDSAFVHLLGMIMVVYDVAVFVWLAKNKDKLMTKKVITFILLLIAFVGQTASEASMFLTTGWSFLALLATCFRKKAWGKYRKIAIIMFSVLLAGGLVMVLAPGLWARAGQVKTETTTAHILINGPVKAYLRLFKSIEPWEAITTISIAFLVGFLMKNKINKKNLKWGIIAGLLVFASMTYIPLVLYYYGSHAIGVEARVLGMPSMGLFASVIIIVATINAYILQNTKKEIRVKYSVGLGVVMSILMVIGVFGIFKFEKGYLAVLSARAAALDVRDAKIREYKSGKSKKLEVADIPVMIEGSEATDFSGNGFTAVEWFYNSFLSYYDIPKEDFRVVGEKLVYGNKPEWYVEGGRQICVLANEIVYEKYLCSELENE